MPKTTTTHPSYKRVTIVMTDGTEFETKSTYHGERMILDADVKTHPAWNKQKHYVDTRNEKVARFNSKYGFLEDLMG